LRLRRFAGQDAEAEGDDWRAVPDIDLTPFIGQEVVLALDLTEGELFSVSL